ncbi:hypothetical protein [Gordonia soli]|uniref:Uncharacterized protein n=1 Tax=Gordonia soli NBRC 108243 TaxID=1223545 RepID=M0QIW6_9ACTN|nr:hypothetical protein [Gordonia soli]GAC68246.1 hypothetical protein GS4_14_00770 [Gordonia soli NBRC 108243]
MINRLRVSRIAASVVAAAAIATPMAVIDGAGEASAVQVYQGQRYAVVWLSHSETRQAASIGLGRFFDQPAVKGRATVIVRKDSKFYPMVSGPVGHRKYYGSAQALVVEASSKPGGQVSLYFDKQRPSRPIGVSQYWPAP